MKSVSFTYTITIHIFTISFQYKIEKYMLYKDLSNFTVLNFCLGVINQYVKQTKHLMPNRPPCWWFSSFILIIISTVEEIFLLNNQSMVIIINSYKLYSVFCTWILFNLFNLDYPIITTHKRYQFKTWMQVISMNTESLWWLPVVYSFLF